jgi:hypothetical protein
LQQFIGEEKIWDDITLVVLKQNVKYDFWTLNAVHFSCMFID